MNNNISIKNFWPFAIILLVVIVLLLLKAPSCNYWVNRDSHIQANNQEV